ncbi:NTP transferase domain-containing protein [Candidatus Dojkabacteria bacterium]|uniref:glucose-1-phosphate thymidylyltransferase n=1 Tax=Candidatus Dojkabacteria bacterium TaxID=2099670 RepID=A0A955L8L6_9BACT|nr:NTP transferase domain-containing protein [Candidatus Dojkabacteria bacterium]
MKGVILAGGTGSRLQPLTLVTNKQLLPVYNKPLIYYPFNLLVKAGINDIMIITSPSHAGHYVRLFESGKKFGVRVTYGIQESPDGLAHGLSLAEDFADDEPVALVLGDNIFEDDVTSHIKNFSGSGAVDFFVEVDDPRQLGCPVFDANGTLIKIEEKPKQPKSEYGQTGLYIFDNTCFSKIKTQKPSDRGELEITDLLNTYLTNGTLNYEILTGQWFDTGTFDNLYNATVWAKELQESNPNYFVI